MFECYCNLFLCNEVPVDRIAIFAFDDGEASVVTSTTCYKIKRETRVSMDVESGIVRFSSEDDVYVCVLVPDEHDRDMVVELIQRLCAKVEW